MKKIRFTASVLSAIIWVGLFSCAGGPVDEGRSPGLAVSEELGFTIPEDVEEVLLTYEKAIRTGDHELFREIVWNGVHFDFLDETGSRTKFMGIDAVAELQLEFLNEFLPREDYSIGMIRHGDQDANHSRVEFRHDIEGSHVWEGATVEKKDGRLLIVHGYVELPLPGSWVSNSIQKLADYNESGFLEGDERHSLNEMIVRFFIGSHNTANPFDEFFDANADGLIDKGEIGAAGEQLFPGWRFHFNFAHWRLEFLGDGYDELPPDNELWNILADMTAEDSPEDEKWSYADELSRSSFPDAVYLPVPREVESLLDELADGNGDGVLDIQEQDIMFDGLTCVYGRENSTDNLFREAIDRERDGYVDWHDVTLILQASAMGWGSGTGGALPPFEVRTAVDDFFDIDKDGRVDRLEIETAVGAFNGDVDRVPELSSALRPAFDWNDDGRVEIWEIEEVKAWLIYPRPVRASEDVDEIFDENSDGFIDPEELGISAGMTSKGPAPSFEERIASLHRREGAAAQEWEPNETGSDRLPSGSEFYRKLGAIQDKKLAVVTLDIGTEKVDQETARGVIMFVENAFVNVGKVKVVDRAHIEEVFDEFEFQSTGVIDESTAVEIGKLSGADIIVIGSINRVGGMFYLNIKLITVQSAEIIGSSISQAESATGFLEMANQAVYKLF